MRTDFANGGKKPVAIVVLTRDSTEESIDAAVKADASAYVVDCLDASRIGSLYVWRRCLYNVVENERTIMVVIKLIVE